MLKECSASFNSGSGRLHRVATNRPNRPRRQAKQARARETVDVVLEAAARVLAEQGYASATTNRIAARAGVSVGTIYEYFSNKEEIFDGLIRRELATLVAAVQSQELDRDSTIDEKLARVVVAAMGAMQYGPELFRALEQVPGATFRRHLADARHLVVAFVKELLEQHREELRVTDLDLAAFMVVSAAEGIGGNASVERFDQRLAEELGTLVRAYLTGA
jgi:AcrR family transcriptional regulator